MSTTKINEDTTDLFIAIVGCRKFNDYNLFKQKIKEWENSNGKIHKIVSGGAYGIDTLAEKYANEVGIPKENVIIHKPDYDIYGRSAGIIRNTDIVNDCDKLIAFPSKRSVGTYDSIRKAKKANKSVTIYNI